MPDKQPVIPLPLGMVKAFLLPGADGRAILVDAGMANTAPRLKRQIAQHGFAPPAISLILLTHGHVDHIGGVPALKEWLQAPVALGRLDAESARSGKQQSLRGTSPLMRMVGRFMGQGGTPSFEPDVLVDEALDLAPYGVAGQALHTPGHSPGSLSIWLEGGDLLVGDLVMGRMLSPTRPGFPIIADDLRVLEQSMARLMDMRPRRIYASHGGPFTPEAMRRAFPWLGTLAQQGAANTGGPAHDR